MWIKSVDYVENFSGNGFFPPDFFQKFPVVRFEPYCLTRLSLGKKKDFSPSAWNYTQALWKKCRFFHKLFTGKIVDT